MDKYRNRQGRQEQEERPALRQIVMLAEKKAEEYRSETVYTLKNPFLFFVKPISKNIVYWYAYSAGKVKNVIWGIYHNYRKTFEISGTCKYSSLEELNDTINYKKTNGFVLLSILAQNNIDELMVKIMNKREFVPEKNRADINMSYRFSDNIKSLGNLFLHFVERNEDLTKLAKNTCLRKTDCTLKNEFGQFGYQEKEYDPSSCNQFFYGEPDHLHEEDEELVL